MGNAILRNCSFNWCRKPWTERSDKIGCLLHDVFQVIRLRCLIKTIVVTSQRHVEWGIEAIERIPLASFLTWKSLLKFFSFILVSDLDTFLKQFCAF